VSRMVHREVWTSLVSKTVLCILQVSPGIATVLLAGAAAAQEQPAPLAIELPQLNVTGTGESAFGPIQGYRTTRSSTATRTDTPIRDVPQGITVLPRELLDDQRITSLLEAVRLSPSVNGGDGYFANFFVRGFEATQLLNGAPRPFGIVSNRLGNELVNVERIEILKGPSSILYGTVAPGGG
jgi:iron complex outermembrane receptor protein